MDRLSIRMDKIVLKKGENRQGLLGAIVGRHALHVPWRQTRKSVWVISPCAGVLFHGKGLTKYELTIEEKEFDWAVIDRKIKFLKLDVKKANECRDQLIELLYIKAEEAEVEAVAQLEVTLLTADQ